MMPIINIGGLALQARGLILLAGFALALWIAEDFARRRNLEGAFLWNGGALALATALAGARLSYVLMNLSSYASDPAGILSPTLQGMAWPEGLLLGSLAALLYIQRRGVPLAKAADVIAPALAAFWAMAGLSAFFSGDAYGHPATVPWAVYMWGSFRHPVQIYEVMAGGALLIALAALWRHAPYPGWLALVALALYGLARLLIEGFRGDPALIGGFRLAQVASLTVTILALCGLYRGQIRHERLAFPGATGRTTGAE